MTLAGELEVKHERADLVQKLADLTVDDPSDGPLPLDAARKSKRKPSQS